MNHPTATIIPFVTRRPTHGRMSLDAITGARGAAASVLDRIFEVDGLVFGTMMVDDSPAVARRLVAVANVTGARRTWAAQDPPWGRRGDLTQGLADEVVRTLRPDWHDSFWSRDFRQKVAHDFARRFLVDAPPDGGHVPMAEISAWMEAARIGRPIWELQGLPPRRRCTLTTV